MALEPVHRPDPRLVKAGPNLPDLFGRRAVERAWLYQCFGRWQMLMDFGWQPIFEQMFENGEQ